jgi:hypothetical protein
MDGHRFDDLTRKLATGTSRRKVLKGLGATVAAAVGTALGRAAAVAGPGFCQQVCGKNAFISGPLHAACLQACRKCQRQGTPANVCFTANQGVVCCPPDTDCCVNCTTFEEQCGQADPDDPFCCEGTIPEPPPEP